VSGPHASRDGENEAFIVDRYLDSLLSRRPADATDVAPELRSTAAALAAGLPRYHPSFRFEETLAARLTGVAAVRPVSHPAVPAAAGPIADAPVAVIPFPQPLVTASAPDGRTVTIRPAVIGGVLTSAAISLAGAAYVAWRRSRPPLDPMSRAVRAAARRRTA
jgi:hypothetical protein